MSTDSLSFAWCWPLYHGCISLHLRFDHQKLLHTIVAPTDLNPLTHESSQRRFPRFVRCDIHPRMLQLTAYLSSIRFVIEPCVPFSSLHRRAFYLNILYLRTLRTTRSFPKSSSSWGFSPTLLKTTKPAQAAAMYIVSMTKRTIRSSTGPDDSTIDESYRIIVSTSLAGVLEDMYEIDVCDIG